MNTESGIFLRKHLPTATFFFEEYGEQSNPFHVDRQYANPGLQLIKTWLDADHAGATIQRPILGSSTHVQQVEEEILINWPDRVELRVSERSEGYTLNAIIENICQTLTSWGEDRVARRISYFASDEDLEEGDVSLTIESVQDFMLFFRYVKSEGNIDLGCTPEGNLYASWGFPDKRGASLWFFGGKSIMFAATDSNGNFIELNHGNETGEFWQVVSKLIYAGLFEWNSERRAKTSLMNTMLHDITTEREIWGIMAPRSWELFFSEIMSHTSQQIGLNISTIPTEKHRLMASSNPW